MLGSRLLAEPCHEKARGRSFKNGPPATVCRRSTSGGEVSSGVRHRLRSLTFWRGLCTILEGRKVRKTYSLGMQMRWHFTRFSKSTLGFAAIIAAGGRLN